MSRCVTSEVELEVEDVMVPYISMGKRGFDPWEIDEVILNSGSRHLHDIAPTSLLYITYPTSQRRYIISITMGYFHHNINLPLS